MRIGDKVYKRRLELKFTQVDLEELSGVPQSVISRIERGILISPRADTIRHLAKALAITSDWLIGMYEESEGSKTKRAALANV